MKKWLKEAMRILFSRLVLTCLLLMVQIFVMAAAASVLGSYLPYFFIFMTLLSILVVLLIVNKPDNPAYKLALVIPIMAVPVFGGLFYLTFIRSHITKKERSKLETAQEYARTLLLPNQTVLQELQSLDPAIAAQAVYLQETCGYPAYHHTHTQYFSPGEDFFDALCRELRNARHFIFMEYFIIQHGVMWDTILDILKEKVAEGVEVRLLYDDMGCSLLLPLNYDRQLRAMGIQCRAFNPFRPVMSITFNNRDHRKITVIDGHTAFTGGINLADEYINKVEKFGHWKDSALMVRGEAAWSFTVMFLNLWNGMNAVEDTIRRVEDYDPYRPDYDDAFPCPETDGVVIPFGTDPARRENLGVSVYLNMIQKAKRSIYICTPYFVVDNETLTALCLAAKSGLDVRIITPYHYDKWYVHILTRSYYPTLLAAGIQVFEYTPGFIHAKSIVCDTDTAVVGSINFDFRSMYLHFECAAFLYLTEGVKEALTDFHNTQAVSQKIVWDDLKKWRWYHVLLGSILRLFAPLM